MIALFVIFPLVLGLACRGSSPDPTATPTEEIAVVVEPTEAPTEAPVEDPTPEPLEEPTEAPVEEPAEDPVQDTDNFQIGDVGGLIVQENRQWIQGDYSVFVAFFIENPDDELIYKDVSYEITLYGSDGSELDTYYESIRWVFPDAPTAVVADVYLADESVEVDYVSVTMSYGELIAPEGLYNPFVVDYVDHWPGDFFMDRATGSITNPEDDTYTDIRVSFIAYDDMGGIVGGGYTFVDFIPGNDTIGFSTLFDTYGDVASIEAFANFTYNTLIYSGTAFWSELSYPDFHFIRGEFGDMVGGALIRNETDTILRNTKLHITFYDAAGRVTAAGSGSSDMLFPGDTVGISPWVSSEPEGATTTDYEFFVLPGDVVDDFEVDANPFVVNSTEIIGAYDDQVAVTFTNNYSKAISDVSVYVLVFNAEGLIIGGGNTWTSESVPAGGINEVEVYVYYAADETVDSIEAWVTPWYWSSFE